MTRRNHKLIVGPLFRGQVFKPDSRPYNGGTSL